MIYFLSRWLKDGESENLKCREKDIKPSQKSWHYKHESGIWHQDDVITSAFLTSFIFVVDMFPIKLTRTFHNLSFFLNPNCMATQNNKSPVTSKCRNFSSKPTFKVGLSPSKKNCVTYFTESPLKMMKNDEITSS